MYCYYVHVFLLLCMFCVLYMCKCVLYYCHRVSTKVQLTNVSYHIIYIYIYMLLDEIYDASENMNVHMFQKVFHVTCNKVHMCTE
jgi:hypothetical protein